jgi:hypothetical protein
MPATHESDVPFSVAPTGSTRAPRLRGPRRFGRASIGLAVVGALSASGGCALPLGGSSDVSPPEAIDAPAAESPAGGTAGSEEDHSTVSGQPIATPCWSYEGPQTFVNAISSDDEDLCVGALELWGEVWDGGVVPTGAGTVYGQVSVEPVRVSTSEAWTVGTDVDGAVDAIADSYFAENGEIISLHEATTLDGAPANITRIEGGLDTTQTKAFITAFAPDPYTPGADAVQFFVIAVITPYDNGDELIDQVIRTWRWA